MRMKKILLFTMVVIIAISMINPATAWYGQTHKDIATQIYNALPPDIQQNLDLTQLLLGCTAPDDVFKDNENHYYPNSLAPTQEWLAKGKAAYDAGDYAYASYCYGVASHYISDTYVGAHCNLVASSKYNLHSIFEGQAVGYIPTVTYMSGTPETLLKTAYTEGKSDWNTWSKTKDPNIVKNEVDKAASGAYSLIKDSITGTTATAPEPVQSTPKGKKR